MVRRITATAHNGARAPSNVVGAGSVDPVAALTWELPAGNQPGVAPVKPVAVPPAPAPKDTTPRTVAFAGTAVLALRRRGRRRDRRDRPQEGDHPVSPLRSIPPCGTGRITLALLAVVPAVMAYPWRSTRDYWVLGIAAAVVIVLFGWWRGLHFTTILRRRLAMVAPHRRGRARIRFRHKDNRVAADRAADRRLRMCSRCR